MVVFAFLAVQLFVRIVKMQKTKCPYCGAEKGARFYTCGARACKHQYERERLAKTYGAEVTCTECEKVVKRTAHGQKTCLAKACIISSRRRNKSVSADLVHPDVSMRNKFLLMGAGA